MKKILIVATLLVMAFMMTACGAVKSEVEVGRDLAKEGNCAAAQPHLDAAIAQPEVLMDMAYAYFYKAQCAEKNGLEAAAYEYYYAAKKVTCYSVERETRASLNTYGRSEFCSRILPEKLAGLESAVGADKVKAIKGSVDEELTERYMERFTKRLSQ